MNLRQGFGSAFYFCKKCEKNIKKVLTNSRLSVIIFQRGKDKSLKEKDYKPYGQEEKQ